MGLVALAVAAAAAGLHQSYSDGDARPRPHRPTPALAHVDDFALLDHEGRHHRLVDYSDAEAVVLVVQSNGCPIVRHLVGDLKTLHDEFSGQGVVLLMLNASPQDSRAEIAAEATATTSTSPC